MNYKQLLNCLLTITVLLFALTSVRAQNISQPELDLPGENVILQWNRILMETIRTPGVHPSATVFPIRSYAMMHAAMFDAVNSIERSYTPYLTLVDEKTFSPLLLKTRGSFRFASKEAAAAQAAHDVLVGLYPSRRAVFNAELAKSLGNSSRVSTILGIGIGQVVAARMLAARVNDGWFATPPPYVLSTLPGNWQPTPPANSAATFTHTPGVRLFALLSNIQFAPPPPPALTSVKYAEDFNEVKAIGEANSPTRTTDQTLVARLWAAVNTPTILFFTWNNVARDVSISRNLDTVENARLFALFNIAVHDALMTSFTSKFQYGLWRPVTAIRRADEDGNPNTAQDPNWSTLIGTPPYPAYAGNMATVGMTHATMLGLFFGRDDIAFQNTWEGTPTSWTRSYSSFTQMAQEEADSRIYGGIHFRFDNEAGQEIGRNAANHVFLNFMRPQ